MATLQSLRTMSVSELRYFLNERYIITGCCCLVYQLFSSFFFFLFFSFFQKNICKEYTTP
jgi:hypothetical protein